MDQAAPTPRRTAWPHWVLLAGLVAYGVFLWRHTVAQPGGSDSSGYFNTAKLLAHGQVHAAMRPIDGLPPATLPPYVYTPLGFAPDLEHGKLVPTYPIGLPLFLLIFMKIFGPETGPALTMVTHAVAGVALLYAVARDLGVGRWLAVLGTVILALSPLYLLFSLQVMSDVPALVCVLTSVWLAWRSQKSNGFATAAGFAVGVAVLVRPSNLLVTLPVVLLLGGSWRRWWLLGLGGLPCALALAWFNHATYGSVLASGYGDVTTLFALRWVPPALLHYLQWFPAVGTPLVMLVLGLPVLWRTASREILILAAWILPFLGFYALYYHTHEVWWYLRFLLPALPALIIAALLVVQSLLTRLPPTARLTGALAVTLLAFASQYYWNVRWDIIGTVRQERIYPDAAHWVQEQLPADAVIYAMQMSGALYYYTDHRLVRWDALDNAAGRIRTELATARHPVYGVFFAYEEKPAMEQKMPGQWMKVAQIRQVGVWRLTPGAATP